MNAASTYATSPGAPTPNASPHPDRYCTSNSSSDPSFARGGSSPILCAQTSMRPERPPSSRARDLGQRRVDRVFCAQTPLRRDAASDDSRLPLPAAGRSQTPQHGLQHRKICFGQRQARRPGRSHVASDQPETGLARLLDVPHCVVAERLETDTDADRPYVGAQCVRGRRRCASGQCGRGAAPGPGCRVGRRS